MKNSLPGSLLALGALILALGFYQLLKLRFDAGDVYPPYSSLRADPLGTMAFYESIENLPALAAERDFRPSNELPYAARTTYLHLAARTRGWEEIPADLFHELQFFVSRGGRLVVTFVPQNNTPTSPAATGNTTTGSHPPPPAGRGARPRRPARPADQSDDDSAQRPPSVSLKEKWGVEFGSQPLQENNGHTEFSPVFLASPSDTLPEGLKWHNSLTFVNLDPAWQVLYHRGADAVLIERHFGAGTVVFASDSYFLSNEALQQDRQPGLLAWLLGSNPHIVFDEAHLGVVEDSSIAMLMRRYHLHGFVAGLLLLAALFIWQSAGSLLPRSADVPAPAHLAGKDAMSGFVNLLRRHIPAPDLLSLCFAEWKKSVIQSAPQKIVQAQAVLDAELSRPARQRDPLRAYREISRILHRPSSLSR